MKGSNVTLVLSLIVAIWSLLVLAAGEFSESSVNEMLRITVRFSFLYFIVAFSASSISFFHKSTFSRWALRNRRYIGIAFGLAFIMHFLGIGLKVFLYPDPFVEGLNHRRIVRGGVMLSAVVLLTLTSSDYAVRKIRPWLWTLVHVTGSYYIFFRFWENYSSFANYDSGYYIVVALLLVAAMLKFAKYIGEQAKSVRLYGAPKI